jgi:hypothetical protein
MRSSRIALLTAALTVLGSCSDDEKSATSSTTLPASSEATTTNTEPPPTANSTAASTATSEPAAPASSPPTTPAAAATTAAVPPAVTDPAVVPAPPDDECPLVPAAQPSAEIVITDDAVQYLGATAPPCLRVYDNQTVVFVNNAEADATVDIGRESLEIAAGDEAESQPVGSYASSGAVVDAYVAELDTAVAIQVIPAQ